MCSRPALCNARLLLLLIRPMQLLPGMAAAAAAAAAFMLCNTASLSSTHATLFTAATVHARTCLSSLLFACMPAHACHTHYNWLLWCICILLNSLFLILCGTLLQAASPALQAYQQQLQ
jgi:hypothetical protein